MSTNKTDKYGLHLWEAGDDFLRAEFNENFSAVAAALAGLEAGKCAVVIGSYTGNGVASRTISLGFTPRLVILANSYGQVVMPSSSYDYAGGLFTTASKHPDIGIVSGGFKVTGTSRGGVSTNSTEYNQSPYSYLAVR